MKFVKELIELRDIDRKDRFFCYSDGNYPRETLLESIAFSGLLNPIAVKEKTDGFQIVTGFRRMEAARALNLEYVPVYAANSDASIDELFRFSILENQTTRTLNLMEKAILISKLKQAKIPAKRIINTYMPLIGLPSSLQVMREVKMIAELPASLAHYILSKDLPVRRYRHLDGLANASIAFIADFVDRLKPSANLFEEITKCLVEIGKRDNLEIEQIIASRDLAALVKNESICRRERLALLRDAVVALRYPILTSKNRKLLDRIEAHNLPSCLDITWDNHLEEKGLVIKLDLKTLSDLDKSLTCIDELQSNNVLSEFMNSFDSYDA